MLVSCYKEHKIIPVYPCLVPDQIIDRASFAVAESNLSHFPVPITEKTEIASLSHFNVCLFALTAFVLSLRLRSYVIRIAVLALQTPLPRYTLWAAANFFTVLQFFGLSITVSVETLRVKNDL